MAGNGAGMAEERANTLMRSVWNRRAWIASQTYGVAALMAPVRPRVILGGHWDCDATRRAAHAERLDPGPWRALVQRAVEAARTAGARYAEARVTRRVVYSLDCDTFPSDVGDEESVGIGVRALVDDYWGFSAGTLFTPDDVVRLAWDAVGAAKLSTATKAQRAVDLGHVPVATGTWETPIRIDPFAVPIEETMDLFEDWRRSIREAGFETTAMGGGRETFTFLREERVVATSEGACFAQTCFESGGALAIQGFALNLKVHPNEMTVYDDWDNFFPELNTAGAGWELLLDANLPEQLASGAALARYRAKIEGQRERKPIAIGKYTLVCDGATMAALVEATLGLDTQLDRALGYEANASETGWLTDPLGLLGTAHITSPLVTLTANRSAPRELATVKWDAEGVEPRPFTLVRDGVLVDFQTTREQAAWLAPYYQRLGQPVQSHGCAAVESAHGFPLQQMPNLVLEPSAQATTLADLVAEVPTGILIEDGAVVERSLQGLQGVLTGKMREITHGRLGKALDGGGVAFSTQDLWNAIRVMGGAATCGRLAFPSHISLSGANIVNPDNLRFLRRLHLLCKGQPQQLTGHSVWAPAAIIINQPVIPWTPR